MNKEEEVIRRIPIRIDIESLLKNNILTEEEVEKYVTKEVKEDERATNI